MSKINTPSSHDLFTIDFDFIPPGYEIDKLILVRDSEGLKISQLDISGEIEMSEEISNYLVNFIDAVKCKCGYYKNIEIGGEKEITKIYHVEHDDCK